MVFKFNIDNVLNQYIPPNRLDRLPKPIGRFLGAHSPKPAPDYLIWLEILVSSFCGILVLEAVFMSEHTAFSSLDPPVIIASYGAAAVLVFLVLYSPLAQPRNVICGQFVSSLIGISIQKLFWLTQTGRDHYYLSAALLVAVANTVQTILNVAHPPSGALALLPLIDDSVRNLGWHYLYIQLVSCILILGVALIFGNIFRSYPIYWWTPGHVGKKKPAPLPTKPEADDEGEESSSDMGRVVTNNISIFDDKADVNTIRGLKRITITVDDIMVPEEMDLDETDINWIEELQVKLRRIEQYSGHV